MEKSLFRANEQTQYQDIAEEFHAPVNLVVSEKQNAVAIVLSADYVEIQMQHVCIRLPSAKKQIVVLHLRIKRRTYITAPGVNFASDRSRKLNLGIA
ncbi:uncharacterized protein N7483_005996 [Penicillium malachiteum]|uniref:uncharacterized protein n=1 Tax=Penicillium malachiteum TaxID=1324776 RepID=UPI002547F4D8|nr:uncharacterized protein N7483_005996 [Penicillium malachiteum]KAJ5731488.1 hypothetical protein N7483_005996 [Penicillium malachiteum]